MQRKRLVVGTAGHIDHGKSSLVRALTGIDPDRLKEEKARGITIELGFAPLTLPTGERLAFVDVPGHERFIRTMVAGATGIDLVLLVISADEGVMPQTREHLDILRLLGVQHGIVVLSKVDLVDDELLELAIDDVQTFLKGSVLELAPIIPCSSTTKAGFEVLLSTLSALVQRVPERSVGGPFRLPIDRVFTLKGFGTVVTGTVASGQVGVGEVLELLASGQGELSQRPATQKVKVRGLQVHGEDSVRVEAGQRAAINLQGIDKDAVLRGDQLAAPGQLITTSLLDVSYQHLPQLEHPLEHRLRVRFLSGTSEVMGVVHVLGGTSLDASSIQPGHIEPGQKGYLQLHLDAPIPARAGDRFILRLESPLQTLGGGVVIDPAPHKHKRTGRALAAQRLKGIETSPFEEKLLFWLELAGPEGISLERLSRRSGLDREALREGIQTLEALHRADFLTDDQTEAVLHEHLSRCREALLERLTQLHAASPLKPGVTRGELKSGLPFFGEKVVQRALEGLLQSAQIMPVGPLYRLASFQIRLNAGDQARVDTLRGLLRDAALSPPLLNELREITKLEEALLTDLLAVMCLSGDIIKIKEGHYAWREAVETLQQRLIEHITAHGELTPNAFKELTGLSRKWAIPLLEHFDRIQLTLRVGDVRKLRGG